MPLEEKGNDGKRERHSLWVGGGQVGEGDGGGIVSLDKMKNYKPEVTQARGRGPSKRKGH